MYCKFFSPIKFYILHLHIQNGILLNHHNWQLFLIRCEINIKGGNGYKLKETKCMHYTKKIKLNDVHLKVCCSNC